MKSKVYLHVILSTIFSALGQLGFKLGVDQFNLTIEGIIFNWPLILGVISYFLGLALLMLALKYGELSRVYPFIALTFIWVALLSRFVLLESISIMSYIGILLIAVGVAATSKEANNA